MSNPIFVLASASPARRQILANAGIQAIVCPSDFDESQIKITKVADLVKTLAQKKAENVAQSLFQKPAIASQYLGEVSQKVLILGCDSLLLVEGEIYGKPNDQKDAIARWQKMRGKVGELYTGHALIDYWENHTITHCQVTKVYFSHATDQQIAAYVATGEPMQCAGCFAIEGKGGLFVEKIEGCHTNVIGLSLPLLRSMLDELGYDATNFWQDIQVGD